jgi:hypothetical protein
MKTNVFFHNDRAAAYAVKPTSVVRKNVARADGGVAIANPLARRTHEEHRYMSKDGQHVRAIGCTWLGPVGLGSGDDSHALTGCGKRLSGSPWLVDPVSLGGRLEVLAGEFTQHKCNNGSLYYEPVVPATTAGGIAFYFDNDISTESVEVGDTEFMNATYHAPDFAPTAVWQDLTMPISPSNINTKYQNSANGDLREEVQGKIVAVSSSDLDNPLEPGEPFTFGQVYLNYDIDFFSQSMDYELTAHENHSFVATQNAYAQQVGAAVKFVMEASTPTTSTGAMTPAPDGLDDVLFYGTCVESTSSAGGGLVVITPDDPKARTILPGSEVYFRMSNLNGSQDWTDGSIGLYMFESLAAAQDFVENAIEEADVSDGQYCYSATSSVNTRTLVFELKERNI